MEKSRFCILVSYSEFFEVGFYFVVYFILIERWLGFTACFGDGIIRVFFGFSVFFFCFYVLLIG